MDPCVSANGVLQFVHERHKDGSIIHERNGHLKIG
jgi:hypothetical protein